MKKCSREDILRLKESQSNFVDWIAEENIFVPLFASRSQSYQGSFVLDDEVRKFIVEPKSQVMLLAGYSGAGKSLYTQGLVCRLWREYNDNDPIPLWVSLPNCKNPENRAIEETLEKCGFDQEQIEELRFSQRFIFIFDAYDEIRCLKNIINTNRLSRWKAKSIVTCSDEYLRSIKNFRNLFTPYRGERPDFSMSTVLYIKPFSNEQIENYIKLCIQRNPGNEWNTLAQYILAFEEIPGVKELVMTPFILKLAIESLPEIERQYRNITDISKRETLTKAMLYDIFIKQWFIRQEKKLKASHLIAADEDVKGEFWRYAKSLAQLMHQHNLTSVSYDFSEDDVYNDAPIKSPFKKFFSRLQLRNQFMQRSCLLREVSPGRFEFIHYSLLEYFLSENIYEYLQSKGQSTEGEVAVDLQGKSDYFNERLLVDDKFIIQLLAERVLVNPSFENEMKRRLMASKNNSDNSIGAANAVSVLVRAGVSLSGFDFTDLKMQHGDLDGLIAYRAIFDRANLSHCSLRDAYMAETSLKGTVVDGAKFGENPSYLWPTGCVTQIIFSHDNKKVFAAGDNNTIIIFDRVTGDSLETLSYHRGRVSSIVVTSDDRYLISSSQSDKTVRLYDFKAKQSRVLIDVGREDRIGITYSTYFPIILSTDEKYIIYPHQSMMGFHEIKKISLANDIHSQSISLQMHGSSEVIQLGLIGENWLAKVSNTRSEYECVIYDLQTGAAIKSINGYRFCVANGRKLIALAVRLKGGVDGIQVYDLTEFTLVNEYVAPFSSVSHSVSTFEGRVRDMSFVEYKGDLILAIGGDDGAIILWDVSADSDLPLTILHGHSKPVTTIAFSADGSEMLSATGELSLVGHGTGDLIVRSWDMSLILENNKIDATHHGQLVGLVKSELRRQIFTAGNDGFIRCWSIKTGQHVRSIDIFPDALDARYKNIRGLCLVEDARDHIIFIVSNAMNQVFRVNLAKNFKFVKVALMVDDLRKYEMCLSPAKNYIAFQGLSSDKESVRIYDYSSLSLVRKFNIPILRVDFSANGEFLAIVEENGCAVIRVKTDEYVYRPDDLKFNAVAGGLGAIKFLPNTSVLVVGVNPGVGKAQKNLIYIIDFAKKEVLNRLDSHTACVSALALSVNNLYLLSADFDGNIIIWETNSWKKLAAFRSHSAKPAIRHAEFVNQDSFVVGHEDGSLRMWSIVVNPQQECHVKLCWHTQKQLCLDGAVASNVEDMNLTIRRLFKQKKVVFQGEDLLAEAVYLEALEYFHSGQAGLALASALRSIELYPYFLSGYTLCGVIAASENASKAEHFFTMGIDKGLERCDNPRAFRELYFYRARLYLGAGDAFAERAVADFKCAMDVVLPDQTAADLKDLNVIKEHLGDAAEGFRRYNYSGQNTRAYSDLMSEVAKRSRSPIYGDGPDDLENSNSDDEAEIDKCSIV